MLEGLEVKKPWNLQKSVQSFYTISSGKLSISYQEPLPAEDSDC